MLFCSIYCSKKGGINLEFSIAGYLDDVLYSYKMKHVKSLMDNYIKKRDEIKEKIITEYSNNLTSNPINSGSYAKHTAINIKFDIDLFVPFKRKSFNTLEEMYKEVYDFFSNPERFNDSNLVSCKQQRTSIGLKFNIDNKIIEMDIIPGREIEEDKYSETGDVNLYDSKKDQQSIKTNIKKHIDLISGKKIERAIIRLLKIWNYRNNIGIKSFLIELIVIKALSNLSTTNLWENLEATLIFIRDNIETVKLPDPANSNNIVTDKLSDSEKQNIKYRTKNLLDRIYDFDENIKLYFPENDEHKRKKNIYVNTKKEPSVLETRSFG